MSVTPVSCIYGKCVGVISLIPIILIIIIPQKFASIAQSNYFFKQRIFKIMMHLRLPYEEESAIGRKCKRIQIGMENKMHSGGQGSE